MFTALRRVVRKRTSTGEEGNGSPKNKNKRHEPVREICIHEGHMFTAEPLIVESFQAGKRVSPGAHRALDDSRVVETKI